jgi:hypothetical protein
MSIARTTPAQKPRGLSSRTRLVEIAESCRPVSGVSRVVVVTHPVYRVYTPITIFQVPIQVLCPTHNVADFYGKICNRRPH